VARRFKSLPALSYLVQLRKVLRNVSAPLLPTCRLEEVGFRILSLPEPPRAALDVFVLTIFLEFWIIGMPFLESVYTVFEYSNLQVGFADLA
jgi:hypothetical protein